jgi:hypothetical protein
MDRTRIRSFCVRFGLLLGVQAGLGFGLGLGLGLTTNAASASAAVIAPLAAAGTDAARVDTAITRQSRVC